MLHFIDSCTVNYRNRPKRFFVSVFKCITVRHYIVGILYVRRRQYRRDQRGTGHVGQQQKGVVVAADGADTADPTPFHVRSPSVVLPGSARKRLRDVRPSVVHGRQVGEKLAVVRVPPVQRPGEWVQLK